MAKQPKKMTATSGSSAGEPRYPYTVAPKSLRRFLQMVPTKPRPPRVTSATLKTWGLKSGNDVSILRVVKSIGLLSDGGEPTPLFAEYMKAGTGAAALGKLIKRTYAALFQNVSSPEKAANDELRNFFNIHSGGSERTIQLQVDTFKALAAYATFGENDPLDQDEGNDGGETGFEKRGDTPPVRVDLHIHLPENKTKADYDAILESIATHIYRRKR